jgi:hypothetical protein
MAKSWSSSWSLSTGISPEAIRQKRQSAMAPSFRP